MLYVRVLRVREALESREGLRLWDAHLYVFYVSGRLSKVAGLTELGAAVTPGGSAKERPSRAWGGAEGGRGGKVGRSRLSPY